MNYIIRPDNDVLKVVMRALSELHPEKEWSIEIKPYKRNLTREQRNYYHKLLDIISDHTGDTVDDLKTRVCFSLGYVRDVKLKDGETVRQRESTETFTKEKYSKMIEAAQIMCLYLELQYPDPKDMGLNIT